MNALITGASRGIGKAVALQLVDAGYNLLLVARTPDTLRSTADELCRTSSHLVKYFACDLSAEAEVSKLSAYASSIDFVPDTLILNAGIYIEGDLRSAPAKALNDTLAVNLMAVFYCVNQFVVNMRAGGRIVIIGSTAGHEAYPIGSLYGVAKWGLRGYAVNLREELKSFGIGVTLISPGGTLTDLWAGEDLPERRLLEPDDIGRLVRVSLSLSHQAVVEDIVVRPMLGDVHS